MSGKGGSFIDRYLFQGKLISRPACLLYIRFYAQWDAPPPAESFTNCSADSRTSSRALLPVSGPAGTYARSLNIVGRRCCLLSRRKVRRADFRTSSHPNYISNATKLKLFISQLQNCSEKSITTFFLHLQIEKNTMEVQSWTKIQHLTCYSEIKFDKKNPDQCSHKLKASSQYTAELRYTSYSRIT